MSDIPIEQECAIEISHPSKHVSQQEIVKTQPAINYRGDCGDGDKPLPCSVNQFADEDPSKQCLTISLGPWVTGKTTYSPEDGITGLRPVADRYSITNSGPHKWWAHNLNIFEQSKEKIRDAQTMISSVKDYMKQTYETANKVAVQTTESLKNRANDTYHWQAELKNIICTIMEEIELLEIERRQAKRSLSVLSVRMTMAGEFLQLRSSRLESDLVRDEVEEQLTKEIALCSKLQDLLNKSCEQIETEISELKAAKIRIENDWSDKVHAYDIDSVCINLSSDSPTLMWKAGAARFPGEQSTSASYDHFTQETLAAGIATKQKSKDLRTSLKIMYDNLVKELRDQATRVDTALATKVKLTEECVFLLENELLCCLREIADTEKLIEELRGSTRGLDNSTKLTQTRLDNRLQRYNVENCRDTAQIALIEEMKMLGECTSGMLGQLKRAEDSHMELIKIRSTLEHEIIVKRKTLYMDKERGQLLRSLFPSITDLSKL